MKNNFIYNNTGRKEQRKYLRKRSTETEMLLWEEIRNKQLGYNFKRQYSIGPYIVDFYCSQKRLIVEIDGSYHKSTKEYDLYRTDYFNLLDIKVLRFWNKDVYKNINKVIEIIKLSLLE